ncbi:11436_t:CDS:2, partial [Dentiscutata heterogama]
LDSETLKPYSSPNDFYKTIEGYSDNNPIKNITCSGSCNFYYIDELNLPEAYIDVEINDILPIPNSSYTILQMEPKSQNICYEETQNNVFAFITSIGGLYSFMSAFYILLFGSPKYSPWGYCQTCPCWWPFRRNYKRHLAKQFICNNGITLFVDNPLELLSDTSSIEDKIVVLGNRLAMLEDLLKKFYLDTSYLELLKETREKYITLYRSYKILESNNTIEEGSE